MAKIYDDAKDKNVALNVIYVQDSGYSYDTAGEDVVSEDDYFDLFAKGVVIVDDGSYKKPIGFNNGDFLFGIVDQE